MIYICNQCNYTTENRIYWYKHKQTNKHKKLSNIEDNINNESKKIIFESKNITSESKNGILNDNKKKGKINVIYNCCGCGQKYSTSSNLSKHKKKCEKLKNKEIFENEKLENLRKEKNIEIENIKKEKNIEIENLKKENEINIMKKKMKNMKLHIDSIKKENEFHKQLVISAGTILSSSVNTLTYLIKNYNKAPVLEPMRDYDKLEEKNKFINNIIYYHKQGKLDQYLGDFLIKHYKTKNPAERQNWSTDTARLTYANRQKVDKIPKWVVDKKGIEMTRIIINPLLNYVKGVCQEHIDELKENIELEENQCKIEKSLYKMERLVYIIKDINDQVVSLDINKYIAPHLYFDKNNIQIEYLANVKIEEIE